MMSSASSQGIYSCSLVLVAWRRTTALELPLLWEDTPALAYLLLKLVIFMQILNESI